MHLSDAWRPLSPTLASALRLRCDITHWRVPSVAPSMMWESSPPPSAVRLADMKMTAFGWNPSPVIAWLPVTVLAANDPRFASTPIRRAACG